MPSDFGILRYRVPKYSRSGYRTLMKTLETSLGFGVSQKAQFRLRCIELLETHGSTAVVTAFPHVSQASVYRWKKKFYDSGRKLNSLIPKSTSPHNRRSMHVPYEILVFLKGMRVKYPHLSKYKLKVFLDEFCRDKDIPAYSVSWIGKVISRHQLFFATRKPVRSRRRRVSRSGYTIKRTPSPDKVKLGYLQLDGITIYWLGQKLVFLTALELKTRRVWVSLVPTASSFHAKALLMRVLDECGHPIHTIHTDNGSEFHALFDQAIRQLNLLHLWSPPRTPKVHSHIERFNGVFQEEFANYHLDEAITDKKAFKTRLNQWLIWYNTRRPHHSLNLKNPTQYLVHLQSQKKGVDFLKSA